MPARSHDKPSIFTRGPKARWPAALPSLGRCIALLGLLATAACATADSAAPPRRDATPPNIVLIVADDMGFSDIGAFGGEIPAPNIDALAARGVSFTSFYNTARCWPTRAALMTGLHQHQVGLGGELQYRDARGELHPPAGAAGPYQGYLSHAVPTLAERLRRLGYQTYAVGKWHLGDAELKSWPTRRGFDHYFGPITGTDSYFRASADPSRARRYVDDEADWPVPRDFYATSAFSERASAYVTAASRDRSKPFFLYLAYTAPHWPLQALPGDVAAQRGRFDKGWDQLREERFKRQQASGIIDSTYRLPPRPEDIPSWSEVGDKRRWAERMEVYAAQVVALDRGIGQVVEALRRAGTLDNTVIMFLSDNGATDENLEGSRLNVPGAPAGSADRYEAYSRNWAFLSNTPFQGYKRLMEEGGIRTPFIVSWPGRVRQPGRLSRQVGHVHDIAPTLVDIAQHGADGARAQPSWSEGESLREAIERSTRPWPRLLFFEHEGNRAVRDGDWKAVKRANGDWRLYDLNRDPTELNDLSAAQPARMRRLASLWFKWARRVGVKVDADRRTSAPRGAPHG